MLRWVVVDPRDWLGGVIHAEMGSCGPTGLVGRCNSC